MKLAYFPGCKVGFYMTSYGELFERIMSQLGVELVKMDFNCCGNPARGEHFDVSILSAIKNFAMAQTRGLDIITPCKCCFGQFKHAAYWYHKNLDLKYKIDSLLAAEDLFWDEGTQIKHFLSFLHEDYGLEHLKTKIIQKLPPKKVAVQYGCHALRPFSITQFDNPNAPGLFEDLIHVLGLKPIEWSKRTECCGNPIFEDNPKLSLNVTDGKFDAAVAAGADYICTACTHCQMQYETAARETTQNRPLTPAVIYAQLLAQALGIDSVPILDPDSQNLG